MSQLVKGWVYVSLSTGKRPKKLRVGVGNDVDKHGVGETGSVTKVREEQFSKSRL